MDSSLDYNNNDDLHLKWIVGNIFFTSLIFIVAAIQLYVFYNDKTDSKNICLASFFIVFFGLLFVSHNLPLSLLSAIIFSNIVMGCNKLNIFSTNEQEKHIHGEKENDIFKKDEMKKMNEENEQHMENPDNQENVVNESKDSILKNADLKIVDEQKHNNVNKKINLENKGELPKPKLKHLNGATFDPYLTSDYNSKAYPNNMAGPNSLKFQN